MKILKNLSLIFGIILIALGLIPVSDIEAKALENAELVMVGPGQSPLLAQGGGGGGEIGQCLADGASCTSPSECCSGICSGSDSGVEPAAADGEMFCMPQDIIPEPECEAAGVCPQCGNNLIEVTNCIVMACQECERPGCTPICNCMEYRTDLVPTVQSVPDGNCGQIRCEATTACPADDPGDRGGGGTFLIPVTGTDVVETMQHILLNTGGLLLGLRALLEGMTRSKKK